MKYFGIILKFLFTSTFYPPFHIGGDANHVKYLAEELAKLGHEVHVFYNRDAFSIKRRLPPQVMGYQKDVIVHKYESPFNLSPYIVYLLGNSQTITKAFKVLINKIQPQVVHHHNISLLGYSIINRFGSYANIYTAHDYWLICQQNNILRNGVHECNDDKCISCALTHRKPPQLWRHCAGFKKTISQLDLIIAPSTYLEKRLYQQFKIRSLVIQNFAPLPPSQIPKQEYSDYYLFVGALEEHKGIINLLQTFKKLRSKIDTKLLIVGKGILESKIKNYIKHHSLQKSVIFVGDAYNESLYSLYHGAKALIIPSICPENSPLVALEAMSVGTPVIASDKGGLPEIVEKVDKKLIFQDFIELENLLSTFSKKPLKSSEIKRIYQKNFSPEAFTEKYMKAILSIKN